MAKTKEISRRIKSINNTKKITRAMEMVAAVKMKKAIEAVLKTRSYSLASQEIVKNLAQISRSESSSLHPLLNKRKEVKKALLVLISSNRGLCGGYNSAIINKVRTSLKRYPDIPLEFIVLGKKGQSAYSQNYAVSAEFTKNDLVVNSEEAAPIAKMILEEYQEGKCDKVLIAYTDFINANKQIPRIKQLLPIDISAEDKYLGFVDDEEKKETEEKKTSGEQYIFEPSPEEVLEKIIPRLIEVQIFQALLEANASEHSARMAAMHQATEAANDMVGELTLFYNKARQAGITAEISEISAGANALSD